MYNKISVGPTKGKRGKMKAASIPTMIVSILFVIIAAVGIFAFSDVIFTYIGEAHDAIFRLFGAMPDDITAMNSIAALQYSVNCMSYIRAGAKTRYMEGCYEAAQAEDTWFASVSDDMGYKQGEGKHFGNTVVKCYAPNTPLVNIDASEFKPETIQLMQDQGFCYLSDFWLPQKVTGEDTVAGWGDPKYVSYFGTFPQGEDKKWQFDSDYPTELRIIYYGLISGFSSVLFYLPGAVFKRTAKLAEQGIELTKAGSKKLMTAFKGAYIEGAEEAAKDFAGEGSETALNRFMTSIAKRLKRVNNKGLKLKAYQDVLDLADNPALSSKIITMSPEEFKVFEGTFKELSQGEVNIIVKGLYKDPENFAKLLQDSLNSAKTAYKKGSDNIADDVVEDLLKKVNAGEYGTTSKSISYTLKGFTPSQRREFLRIIAEDAESIQKWGQNPIVRGWEGATRSYSKAKFTLKSVAERYNAKKQEFIDGGDLEDVAKRKALNKVVKPLIEHSRDEILMLPPAERKLAIERARIIGARILRTKTFQFGTLDFLMEVNEGDFSAAVPLTNQQLEMLKCFSIGGTYFGFSKLTLPKLFAQKTLFDYHGRLALCGTIVLVGYTAMKADSVAHKFEPQNVNSLYIQKALLAYGDIEDPSVREDFSDVFQNRYVLNDYANHYFVRLMGDVKGDNRKVRFYAASPCKGDVVVTAGSQKCVIHLNGDWAYSRDVYVLGDTSNPGSIKVTPTDMPFFNFGTPEGKEGWFTTMQVKDASYYDGTHVNSLYWEDIMPACWMSTYKSHKNDPLTFDPDSGRTLTLDDLILKKNSDGTINTALISPDDLLDPHTADILVIDQPRLDIIKEDYVKCVKEMVASKYGNDNEKLHKMMDSDFIGTKICKPPISLVGFGVSKNTEEIPTIDVYFNADWKGNNYCYAGKATLQAMLQMANTVGCIGLEILSVTATQAVLPGISLPAAQFFSGAVFGALQQYISHDVIADAYRWPNHGA